jgi:gamma-glutamyltranspeptidase
MKRHQTLRFRYGYPCDRNEPPWPLTTRAVEGRSAFIAATMSPIATRVGMQTLRSGGTAADAAIATALTQVATNLGSIISYAGVLQLVYYDAKTGHISMQKSRTRHEHALRSRKLTG